MNDSRRRQLRAARASLLVAALGLTPSCGSSASPSAAGGASQTQAAGTVDTESRPGRATARSAVRSFDPTSDDDESVPVVIAPHGQATAALCNRESVAFNLSALTPVDPTPAGFASAWRNAREQGDVPGFVVAYTDAFSGPPHANVGPVYLSRNRTWSFMPALPTAGNETLERDPADPLHVKSTHSRERFVTAFGTINERSGFVVSRVTVEGRLDAMCRRLRDVVVTMTLPPENVNQRFAGFELRDALGPPMPGTGGDGIADGWTVKVVGDSLSPLNFQ